MTEEGWSAATRFSVMLEVMNEREIFGLFNNVEYLRLFILSDTFTNEDIALLSQFRHLRKMYLHLPFFHNLASYFPTLTHLLLSCYGPVQDQTQAEGLNLPNLERLGIYLDVWPSFPAELTVYAPKLEHLALRWTSDTRWEDVSSIARNLIASIPLENIKTVNLTGHSWDELTYSMQIDPILSSNSKLYFMCKFVNLQTLGLNYSTPRSVGGQDRPDTVSLIQILSTVRSKHLRTLILVVPFRRILRQEVHLTFDNSRWKVLDELLCDAERFRVLGKVMLVVDYFDPNILLVLFNRGSEFGLIDSVKMAFKGLTSTRRLQLVLRCVTIFIFNLCTISDLPDSFSVVQKAYHV
jgi:hypothetical protein